jgi:hypothetical protein
MIMLVALLAAGVPEMDSNAAVMYIQSYAMPALFDVCKSAMPDSVGEFDKALSAWKEKNSAVIAKGESVVRERAKRDNFDVEAVFSSQRQSTVSWLNSLNQQSKKEKCEYMLQVTRAEN